MSMSRNNEYDDYDDDNENEETGNGPRDLRKALAKANKRAEDLQKQVEDLNKQVTTSRLGDIMRERKVPANIQRWMKRDEVEASPEAVDKWLDENGADFGWKPESEQQAENDEAAKEKETQPQVQAEQQQQQQGVLTQEDIDAYVRMQQIGQVPSDNHAIDPVKAAVDAVANKIDLNADPAAVARMLQEAGVPIQSQIGF